MSVLVYVIAGVSIAAGGLAAGWYLLSLAAKPAWSRLRHLARVSPASKPLARRGAWNNFGSALALVLVGTLLLLGVNDKTASWLGSIAVTALLFWQLASMLMSRVQRRSVS
jgi:hypothetical protein